MDIILWIFGIGFVLGLIAYFINSTPVRPRSYDEVVKGWRKAGIIK